MAINAANVVLVQRVSVLCLRGFEYPRRIAHGCAALFACHPVHVEAVAGIVGRGDLLAHFFGLIAILVYFHGCDSTYSKPVLAAPLTKVPYITIITTALLIGSAMLCKETGVCVLAIIAVLDVNTICNLEPLQLFSAVVIAVKAMASRGNACSSAASTSTSKSSRKKGAKGRGKAGASAGASASSSSAAATTVTAEIAVASINPKVAVALLARQLLLWSLTAVMLVWRFSMNRDDEVSVDWYVVVIGCCIHTL